MQRWLSQLVNVQTVSRHTLLFAVFVFLLICTWSPVTAQDALGSGNALDNNLNQSTGRTNLPVPQSNFRERNQLITGNVIGGRGFRGSVGYSAPLDFRESVGSDDFFQFRASSAYSSPELLRLGTTYEQLRFGQALGTAEFRRSSAATNLDAVHEQRISPGNLNTEAIALERAIKSSSSTYREGTSSEPIVVGSVTESDSTMLIHFSSVRGLAFEPAETFPQQYGLTTFDLVRVREDTEADRAFSLIGEPFQTRFASMLDQVSVAKAETEAESPRVTSSMQPDYQQILQRIADRYTLHKKVQIDVQPDMLARLDDQFQQLRTQLMGEVETADKTQPKTGMTPDMVEDGQDGEDEEMLKEEIRIRPEDFGVILRHGKHVTSLSAKEEDRFSELMELAELKLQEGEYIIAERRFERAMRFVPGHPMAMVGVTHSQIGAGFYRSASISIRELFTQRPEMIDATYSDDLLPGSDRLEIVINELREAMDDPDLRATHSLVLAYVGRQIDDREMMKLGLDVLAKENPDDPLEDLLRSIWLGGEDTKVRKSPPRIKVPQPSRPDENTSYD